MTLSSNHHPALAVCLSMSFFAKPVPTFAGHALISELLAHDPLLQTMPWIEQHLHADAVVHGNVDGGNRTHLVVVGNRGDRTFFRLQYLHANLRAVRQKGAVPASGPK